MSRPNPTRRQFLGEALGAGGLLLPVAGKGALALPGDLGEASALPVTPAPLPVSPEMLSLREVRQELHEIHLWDTSNSRSTTWRNVMRHKGRPLAEAIVGRKHPTWRDCLEIAEVALHQMYRRGPRDRSDPLCALVFAVLSAGGQKEFFIPELGLQAVETSDLCTQGRN